MQTIAAALAIGQNGADSGGRIGAVFLVDGDSTGEQSLSDVGHRWMGESAIEKTADSLAGVGDVNGDGVADLTILLDAEAPVDANWFVL